MLITHLGWSGLALHHAGARILVDPASPPNAATVVTWTEAERIAGVQALDPPALAAAPAVLAWLGKEGRTLGEAPVELGGWRVTALPYAPIPYATPPEAVRKTMIALQHPVLAARRLRHAIRRPATPPLALLLEAGGLRVALAGQALHRFTTEAAMDALLAFAPSPDILLAGTDFDDEAATGRLAARFNARQVIIADLTGPVRRKLGLPTRPLTASLDEAPRGTHLLEERGHFQAV